MTDSLDVRAKRIIDQLIEMGCADRAAQLDRACGEDGVLRGRVESLLCSMQKDDAFLRNPSIELPPPLDQDLPERPGGRIGPYVLVELIGEGGFGSVFMAEQSEPVRRRVALKIIKLGMDTRSVVARFEQERQALALMEHPNIAKVFDAGATHSGRPYFVMELVSGEPITRFCDQTNLDISERLALFVQVCRAVQHAHQKGVIHRDLKPSNVLVTSTDGEPRPKVIDFGIAKAVSGRLTDKTLMTEVRQLLGTPQYMSPEQAEPTSADIDTRSDIYSLGVLLYELLTGTTPFDPRDLADGGYDGFLRMLREREPPRPSLRLHTLAASSGHYRLRTPADHASESAASSVIDIARKRRLEPMPLTQALRGDLDWIVMKCLEKDRARRYETASALADDVGRYLDHQPVLAIPPSAGYRFRKFVRRNRGAVLASAVAVSALLIATGVSVTFGLSEARQREAAEVARGRAERAEQEAKSRADELEQVASFQQEQLSGIDAQTMGVRLRAALLENARAAAERSKLPPEEMNERMEELERLIAGSDFTGMALEALDENVFQRALSAIDEQFGDQPLVKARLLQTVSSTLHTLGLLDAAAGPQQEALEIRRKELGDEHPDTLASMSEFGVLLKSRGNLAESFACRTDVLEKYRRVLGDEHPGTLDSIDRMGAVLHNQGKLTEAEDYYLQALEKRRRVLGEEHPATLTTMNNLGLLLRDRGRLEEAEIYLRETLDTYRRVLGDEAPRTIVSLNNLGVLLHTQGKLAEAEVYYRQALDTGRRVLGEEHPNTLASISRVGALLLAQGKLVEAETYCREALEKRRRILGEGHISTINSFNNVSAVLQAQGKLSEAETYVGEALDQCRRALGDEHPGTLTSVHNMGFVLMAQDKLDEAEPFLREALEKSRLVLGDDNPDTLVSIMNLGALLMMQNRLAEAEPYFREALERTRRVLGDEHVETIKLIGYLGGLLQDQGKSMEAIGLLAPAEPAARKSFVGGNAVQLGRWLMVLGRARAGNGEFEAAEATMSEAQSIFGEAEGSTDQDRTDLLSGLVELYDDWHAAEPDQGHDAEAAQWRAELQAWQASTQPAPGP